MQAKCEHATTRFLYYRREARIYAGWAVDAARARYGNEYWKHLDYFAAWRAATAARELAKFWNSDAAPQGTPAPEFMKNLRS